MHIASSLALGLSVLSFTAATGTVQLEFKRNEEIASRRAMRKRQSSPNGTASTSLQLFKSKLYFVDIAIGTPPQAIKVQLDTGSSELFALAPNVTNIDGGSFDPTKSSTFDDILPGNFSSVYGDGSGVTGDYFTDQLSIAGVTVDKLQMGVGYTGNNIGNGIIGISYQSGEENPAKYPTVIETMVSQALISTPAYSIWLNDFEAASGSILFAGIDTSKYSGSLANIAIYPSQFKGIIDTLTVQLTSISVTSPSGKTDVDFDPFGVVLDSGTSGSVLPDEIVSELYSITGAIWNSAFGLAAVLCSARSIEGSFTFGFAGPNGPSIAVPISQFIIPITLADGTLVPAALTPNFFPHASPGDTLCQVNVTPRSQLGVGEIGALLGDSFMRSAYVVFDLANNRVALAPTVFNSSAPANVVPFASSGAPIPSASTVSEPSLTYSVTGLAAVTSAPPFTQTAPFFSGSAGPAFASAVAAGEAGNITSVVSGLGTGTGGTTGPTSSGKSSAAAGVRPFAWNYLVVVEVLAGLFAMGFAIVLM
ncbi:acid protease [Stipitochalara longipes BDJ]|nr:acid protease [Stipitochalara longipes BDJ]